MLENIVNTDVPLAPVRCWGSKKLDVVRYHQQTYKMRFREAKRNVEISLPVFSDEFKRQRVANYFVYSHSIREK